MLLCFCTVDWLWLKFVLVAGYTNCPFKPGKLRVSGLLEPGAIAT